jgi:hypothetical protein
MEGRGHRRSRQAPKAKLLQRRQQRVRHGFSAFSTPYVQRASRAINTRLVYLNN